MRILCLHWCPIDLSSMRHTRKNTSQWKNWSCWKAYIFESVKLCRKYFPATLIQECDTLQWRHNERDGVSNNQLHNYLLNRLFRYRSQKTSKLRATGLCEGNSPMTGEFSAQRTSNELNILISIFVFHYPCYHVITNMILFVVLIAVLCTLTSVLIANIAQFVVIVVFLFLVYHVFQHHRVYWMLCAQAYYSVVLLLHGQFPTILAIQTPSASLGLALLTLSWDKNWDSHSLVNGYPSFYPRIALVAPSPEGLHCHNVRDGVSNHQLHNCLLKRLFRRR